MGDIKKVLIISHDLIGSKMSGPGIRYHYMAETLSKDFDVTIGFFGPQQMPDKAFEHSYGVRHIDVHHFEDGFAPFDVVIALWISDAQIAYCNLHKKLVVFDIYAPVPVENLAVKIFSGENITQGDEFEFAAQIRDYRRFLENGDAFLYSNQRQLDFWVGYAFGAGQVSPASYLKRPVLEQFIKAPMGIDTSNKLKKTKQLYKGIVDGIKPDDLVIVWSGGIYNWYDGVTLVEAMQIVQKRNPKIKLIFPAIQHPNAHMRKWQETTDTVKRAEELEVVGKSVFFFEKWIPYGEISNFLLEADMGIYTHKMSIETEFSHRTRVIDSYFLASLPTIATDGDHFADFINRNNLGTVVPPYDPKALAEAILAMAHHDQLAKYRANIQIVRKQLDWSETLSPLIAYLNSNPVKVPKVATLTSNSRPRTLYRIGKRLTPKTAKKVIIKVLPHSIKRKLLQK